MQALKQTVLYLHYISNYNSKINENTLERSVS